LSPEPLRLCIVLTTLLFSTISFLELHICG